MDERDDLDLKEIGRRAGETAEKEWIQQVLLQTRWNRKKAASLLQVSYKTLLSKIEKYRLHSLSERLTDKRFEDFAHFNE